MTTKKQTGYIVTQACEAEYDVKKSHFIGRIMPCLNEQHALAQLQQFAQSHPNASHLAFAWRIRQQDGLITERCHDAGEPSGTAGRPILAPLEGERIINAVVGVIRYFGGIKLGTGGLARAYGMTAKRVIEHANIEPWIEQCRLEIVIDYTQLQSLEYQLKKLNGQILSQAFTDRISLTIELPAEHQDTILQLFAKQQ